MDADWILNTIKIDKYHNSHSIMKEVKIFLIYDFNSYSVITVAYRLNVEIEKY